jgi:hypothetical protein
VKDQSLKIRVELIFFVFIVLLASALRLGNLGELPLTDPEAVHALAAASSTEYASPFPVLGEPIVPHSAAYHSLTAMLFTVFGPSNALARLIPALFGIAFVLLPLCAQSELGRSRAWLMALLLSVSPSLVTISRTAGGASIGLFGAGALALGLLRNLETSDRRRQFWLTAGIGFLLASGVTWLHLLISVGVAMLVYFLWRWLGDRAFGWRFEQILGWRTIGIALIFTGLLASGIGLFPSGLIGLSSSFGDWFAGWAAGAQLNYLPAWTWLISIPIYETLIVVLGFIGLILLARKDNGRGSILAWLSLGALIYFLIYPGRDAASVAIVLIPWTYFGASVLESLLDSVLGRKHPAAFYILASLLYILTVHMYFFTADLAQGPSFLSRLASLLNTSLGLEVSVAALQLSWIIIVAFVCLAMIVVVGQGWGWKIALQSGAIVLVLVLSLTNLASIWRLNFTDSAATAQELWRSHTATPIVYLMRETLERMSLAHTGTEHGMAVRAETPLPAAIAWELRDFEPPDPEQASDSEPVPAIISPLNYQGATLPADYIGQSLRTHEGWAWAGILPPNPVRWWVQRSAPTLPESWVVLIRQDIVLVGESDELE